jgi:hypothetical protein
MMDDAWTIAVLLIVAVVLSRYWYVIGHLHGQRDAFREATEDLRKLAVTPGIERLKLAQALAADELLAAPASERRHRQWRRSLFRRVIRVPALPASAGYRQHGCRSCAR